MVNALFVSRVPRYSAYLSLYILCWPIFLSRSTSHQSKKGYYELRLTALAHKCTTDRLSPSEFFLPLLCADRNIRYSLVLLGRCTTLFCICATTICMCECVHSEPACITYVCTYVRVWQFDMASLRPTSYRTDVWLARAHGPREMVCVGLQSIDCISRTNA